MQLQDKYLPSAWSCADPYVEKIEEQNKIIDELKKEVDQLQKQIKEQAESKLPAALSHRMQSVASDSELLK